MRDHESTIEKLPNETLLRILEHLYPPAAFQPFDAQSICPEDSAWHEHLLDAHLDMVRVSKVSRLFQALSVRVAQRHARLITEEKKDALVLRELSEAGTAYFKKCEGNTAGKSLKDYIRGVKESRKGKDWLAARKESEHVDSLSWIDIGRIHLCRVVWCAKIMAFRGLHLAPFVQDRQLRRFGISESELVKDWTVYLRQRRSS